MKRFRCGDVVPGCDAEFTGSEPEILSAVGVHARDAHGITEVSPELVAQVRAALV
jgi:predicted small metal-binding protein